MEDRYNVWICLSDLLAGIMAFFIFVSVGLYANYIGLEGIAYGEMTAGSGYYLPPYRDSNVSMRGNAIHFGGGYFGLDSCTLKSDVDLEPVVKKIRNAVAESQGSLKILIVGHTSCQFDVENANWPKLVEGWKHLTPLEQVKEIERVASSHNAQLALNRAFAIYKYLWADEGVRKIGENNIRYIGMAEHLAAGKQNDVICRDRSNKGSGEFDQSAQVFLVEEWPSTYEISELVATKPDFSKE